MGGLVAARARCSMEHGTALRLVAALGCLIFTTLQTRAMASVEDSQTLVTLRANGFRGATFVGDSAWDDLSNQFRDACSGVFPYASCGAGDRVEILDLSGLGIEGQLDPVIGDLRGLRELRLGGNQFFGPLPGAVGALSLLEVLDVGNNSFSGSLPDLSRLAPNLTLNLAHNLFSGKLPATLKQRFCYDVFADNPVVKGLNRSGFPPCTKAAFVASPPPPAGRRGVAVAAVAGGAAGGAALALLLATLAFVLALRRIRRPVADEQLLSEEDLREIEEGLEKFNFRTIRRFTLEELQVATSNWADEIGAGGSSIVYRGQLTGEEGEEGKVVAVKRAKAKRVTKEEMVAFYNEMDAISRAVHRNVVRLEGFCIEEGERILLFPFMENGSVEDHLRGRRLHAQRPLSLITRHEVAVGAARGLVYLHTECSAKIIHRDIKAANVLLTKNYEAMVTDFGLAKLTGPGEDRGELTKVRGTFGHIAPEYILTGRLTEKADVYAYGVFLLELITGLPATAITKLPEAGEELKDWVSRMLEEERLTEVIDLELRVKFLEFDEEELKLKLAQIVPLLQVAVICLIRDPDVRPTMADCVRLLQGQGLVDVRDKIRQEVPESVLNWNPSFGEYSSLSQSLMSFMTESNMSEVGLELHQAR